MKKYPILLVCCLLLTTLILQAQRKKITGTVVNETTGEVVAGATVSTTGKPPIAVTTGADGSFSISVPDNVNTLVVSSVGFTTQTVSVQGNKALSVRMAVSNSNLDDVVVIGYGTQKKSNVTGAVSKFKAERLDEAPVARLDQALQGKIAGVQVQNISSEAGSDPKIRIRGISSINAGANPLVVVDGHPVPDGLAFVNNADVESVEVLKDAASAAIYGSRGASGVILVTTKSGKVDRPKYNIKMATGYKTQYELYPMMTTSEYTQMLFDEAALKAKDPSITPPTGTAIAATNERAAYVVENDLMKGVATNWQEEGLRKAQVHNIQFNVSGGSKAVKYFVSGAYVRDQGMMYHSENDRYSLRSRVDMQLSKRVKFTLNVNPSYIKRERPSVNFIDFVRFQSYLPVIHNEATAAFVNQDPLWVNIRPGDFAQARHFNRRIYSGLMPDGSSWSSVTATDPFNTANNTPKSAMETRTITSNDYRVQSSGDLTVNIMPGLDFRTLASVYVNQTNGLDFAKRGSNREGDVNRGVYTNRTFIDLLSENTLNYNKAWKDHTLGVLAGFTAQKTQIRDEQITGLDYPSDNITTLNTALQIDQSKEATFNTRNQIGLLSWLGRVSYAYKNKYLLTASWRADGSSYFAPGNKWGSFPSISAGWIVTQESFMQSVNWLNNLKLRASYGVTGNNRIVDFAFVDLLFNANYPFGTGTGTVSNGQVPSRDILANPEISWERTFQYNGGIDLGFLKNAITLSVDVYQSKTDQLLLRQNVMGFAGVPQTWNNIGRLQNNGFEVDITSQNIRRRKFRWSTSINFSRNTNKLLELGGEEFQLNQGERTELYMNRVGDPLIQYFGYRTNGVWLSQKEIDDARAAGLTSTLSNVFIPGGLKLVDLNGDNRLDANDRTVIGSPYPDFIYGITNNFNIGLLDLSFLIQGVQGGELVNGDANYNETKRYNKNYNQNRWLSPAYPGDGRTPYSTNGFNWMLTDYVVEDASYITLREIIIGLSVPKKLTDRLRLGGARFYMSAQNVFFHTNTSYRGINVEGRFTTGPYNTPLVDGYQRGSFPMPKTFMFGLDLNF